MTESIFIPLDSHHASYMSWEVLPVYVTIALPSSTRLQGRCQNVNIYFSIGTFNSLSLVRIARARSAIDHPYFSWCIHVFSLFHLPRSFFHVSSLHLVEIPISVWYTTDCQLIILARWSQFCSSMRSLAKIQAEMLRCGVFYNTSHLLYKACAYRYCCFIL